MSLINSTTMKVLAGFLSLVLCGCQKAQPEQPAYFYQRTVENADGSTLVITYTGPKPPPWDEKE